MLKYSNLASQLFTDRCKHKNFFNSDTWAQASGGAAGPGPGAPALSKAITANGTTARATHTWAQIEATVAATTTARDWPVRCVRRLLPMPLITAAEVSNMNDCSWRLIRWWLPLPMPITECAEYVSRWGEAHRGGRATSTGGVRPERLLPWPCSGHGERLRVRDEDTGVPELQEFGKAMPWHMRVTP